MNGMFVSGNKLKILTKSSLHGDVKNNKEYSRLNLTEPNLSEDLKNDIQYSKPSLHEDLKNDTEYSNECSEVQSLNSLNKNK